MADKNNMKRLFIIIVICGLSSSVFAKDLALSPQRIVSLAPSMTEILFALGLGDRIAGVTSFCDYPEEAKKKPKIGGMSNPSLEAVVSLKPDIVVMTTDGNPKEFEELLHSLKVKTYVFTARRLSELPQGIRDLGRALGVKERADTLAKETEAAINRLAVRSQPAPPARSYQQSEPGRADQKKIGYGPGESGVRRRDKKVLFIVWPEPLIVAGPGTVMDDAVRLLGYENIAGSARAAYPKYSIEEVIREAPDFLFIGKGSGMDMRTVSQGILKKLTSVPAVKNGAVFYVSDSLYRLGPRVVAGIEELAACLK